VISHNTQIGNIAEMVLRGGGAVLVFSHSDVFTKAGPIARPTIQITCETKKVQNEIFIISYNLKHLS